MEFPSAALARLTFGKYNGLTFREALAKQLSKQQLDYGAFRFAALGAVGAFSAFWCESSAL